MSTRKHHSPIFNYRLRQLAQKTVLLTAVLTEVAQGEPNTLKHHFNIPAESLNQALLNFGRQSQQPLLYSTDLVENMHSRTVQGDYTVNEALEILLGETSLQAVTTSDGNIKLQTKPVNPQNKPDSASLPAVKVVGNAIYAATDPYNPYYNRTNAATATKTDTPIMETPAAIQVVPAQVLKDQQAITLADGLKNVSGVQVSPSTTYENFTIRGFDANSSTYRDGIKESSWAVETANVERLEVLKGPGAILYGRIEPGGMINRVLKKPLDTPYYSIQQQFGSFDMYRTTADATGPLNQDRSLTYRINFAYQDSNSFRDLVFRDRVFIAPQLNWKISDRTEIGFGMEYQRDNYRWDDGFPVYLGANRPIPLPINRSLTDIASNDHQEREVADFHWSHAFNDDWKISQQFSTFQSNQQQYHIFPFTWPGVPNNSEVTNRSLWDAHYSRNTYSANTNLLGHFATWGVKHTALIGHDYYRFDGESMTNGADSPTLFNMFTGSYNAFNLNGLPQWGANYTASQQEWNGVYFQDQMVLWDKLHIMGGGRQDWASFGLASSSLSQNDAQNLLNASPQITAEKFSPRVGILYRPWQWLSIYGNYTESLGAQNNWNGRNANGTPLKPQEANQYEAGVKTEFFDGRLTSTLAYFEVRKTNVATADISSAYNLLNGYMKEVGEERSRGIEFDISGQLSQNWSIIANYAWIDSKITKDNNGYQGNRFPNAPEHSGNLWTKYEFDQALKGLSIASGLRVVSERQGDPQNDFQLPGYVTWDGALSYKFNMGPTKLTTQLNAYNLLDKQYFIGADTLDQSQRFYGNMPGSPRSFMGTIKIEY